MIYLDNAATTPVSEEVLNAMRPYFSELYGNPSSVHTAGRQTKGAIERAREQVAQAIHANPNEVVFTSGGTEADNAAIVGTALGYRERGKHLVTTTIEHHAVLHTFEFLQEMGYEVTYVSPRADGIVQAADIAAALRADTTLVSVMAVNNETGARQPIAEIGRLTRERGILFHTDAVQAVGLLELDVEALGVDLLSISGHKLHGPKGVGALYVRRGLYWKPTQHGGAQEFKRRAGTENLPGIIGLGVAVELATARVQENYAQVAELRDAMLAILRAGVDGLQVNSPEQAVPSILNVTFPGAVAERILMNLDMAGIMAASGSACTSGSLQPSHVLMAMGLAEESVRSAVRFSFSGQNTLEEVTQAAHKVVEIVQRLQRR
ncbi:cysteine desulfurase NifS [Tumebacillus algifaecis]|uniref:cysteine desulfurase n=1 Tax=Tumebacillus algifaecis TaxID=1214604 RepID=A0A223CZF5_9BACL|nr:cysteine desulfurase family protein [Tumebacillus algifaecis]ASS74728.1 cysteine desulfurase NifS [Tumebacillus algifaecis]